MEDAIKLYNRVCDHCSEIITKSYSTSFSLGIRTLHWRLHKPIYSVYGFVRFADELPRQDNHLFFASADHGEGWRGFIEGAIASGSKTAVAVAASLDH